MKKIEDTFLKEGDLFLARWKQGYTLHLINGIQTLFHRKFTNNISEIGTETNMSPTRLEDDKEEDYLYIRPENGEINFLYGSIGIEPVRIRGYWIVPEKSGTIFNFPNVEPASPSRGDDYGYFDGYTNPINEPSEFFAITIPPGIHVNLDLYNPYETTKQPTLSLKFAHYLTEALNFRGNEKLVRELFSPAIEQKKILSMGNPFDPIEMRSINIENFGIKPLPFETLKKLIGSTSTDDIKYDNQIKNEWR